MPKNLYPILGSRIGGAGHPGSRSVKATTALITKGDVCAYGTAGDAGKVLTASTSATAPFVACAETKPLNASPSNASIYENGLILLKAQGAIEVGKYVMRSASVAGRVSQYDGSGEEKVVGRYLRHEGEDSGDQTNAADGDIIVVDFGVGMVPATT